MRALSKDIDEFIDANLSVSSYGIDEISCFCPFHTNQHTPSFSINRHNGLWCCYNPDCGEKGSIAQLAAKLGLSWAKGNKYLAAVSDEEIIELLEETTEERLDDEWEDVLENILIDYSNPEDLAKLQYLLDRGFQPSILEQFEIAYSEAKDRIVIPTRDESHKLVGFIGRATSPDVAPKYMYSRGFPKKSLLFNLNNAKNYSSVIVTEGSLDCIKIHQAGFPNVISVLGANVTPQQGELLDRFFNEIILFLDNDVPGRVAMRAIMDMCYGKKVWIVPYSDINIKDPGDMTEAQIREAIINKTDSLNYLFNEGELH